MVTKKNNNSVKSIHSNVVLSSLILYLDAFGGFLPPPTFCFFYLFICLF